MIGTIPACFLSPNAISTKATLASDFSMTVDAPELCQDCTVSLNQAKLAVETADGGTNTITVFDDGRQVDICTISLRLSVNAKTIILADNCGSTFADVGEPPIFGGARQ